MALGIECVCRQCGIQFVSATRRGRKLCTYQCKLLSGRKPKGPKPVQDPRPPRPRHYRCLGCAQEFLAGRRGPVASRCPDCAEAWKGRLAQEKKAANPKGLKSRSCHKCGMTYNPKSGQQKWCSAECSPYQRNAKGAFRLPAFDVEGAIGALPAGGAPLVRTTLAELRPLWAAHLERLREKP